MNSLSNFFSVQFTGKSVTAACDLFTVQVPAGRVYQLHEIRVGQYSDSGDAEAELHSYKISRHVSGVTPGSGGTAVVPVPWSARQRDITAKPSWTVVNTTQLSSTREEVVYRAVEYNQVSFLYVPQRDIILEAVEGDTLVVSLETTPADVITLAGTLIFREVTKTPGT